MTETAATEEIKDINLDQDVGTFIVDSLPDPPPPEDIFAKAILLKLDTGVLGQSKRLATSEIEVDADKARVSVSKRILDCKQFDDIKGEIAQASKRIRNLCLPSMFKRGIYLLPIASIEEADQILVESQAAIEGFLVPAFLEVYPSLVEADKLAFRGGTYNPADYPPVSAVERSFVFEWSYLKFGVPEQLSNISREILQREQAKAQSRLTEAVDEIRNLLRSQMLDLVTHLADQMSGAASNGRAKAIKTATVVNINKFLEEFKAKNITNDAELDALCDQAKGLLNGVDPQALRESETIKARVAVGFESIKADLSKLVVDKPSRLIVFDQPEETQPEPEV